jgi:hypothetical protein
MEINITRAPSVKGATIGRLSVDGLFLCYTLEDEVREPNTKQDGHPYPYISVSDWVASWKIQNKTAIPRGRYRVVVNFSPHFQKELPELCDVPGFSGVRIHSGNSAADTEGCILVGLTTEANLIYHSKDAFKLLFPKIQAALAAKQDVFLSIS